MMLPRTIPVLLIKGSGLVKTVQFKNPFYLGDPRNIIKIFNEKEADELLLLDIQASINKQPPNYELITELTSECFMPLGYGGGITDVNEVERLFSIGVEKVIINSMATIKLEFISALAKEYGSQSIVVSIDYKEDIFGRKTVYGYAGRKRTGLTPKDYAMMVEESGAGEIILNSIKRDGMMMGYDLEEIKRVSAATGIPLVACGGAKSLEDMRDALINGASAVAAGSMFVYHGPHKAVLINFPKREQLIRSYK